ncbi:MAG TPA: peptidase, partial [Cyclobacteriaceae bacterium]|nr:peptidase [Cyclobacteriaceae bacterium]
MNVRRKSFCVVIILLTRFLPAFSQKSNPMIFTIDMTGPSTDTFLVELEVPKLTKSNKVYQFASTAPGAYQVMDIGRFVSHFKAVDKKGREITVKKIQVNQYEIEHPEKVRRITY